MQGSELSGFLLVSGWGEVTRSFRQHVMVSPGNGHFLISISRQILVYVGNSAAWSSVFQKDRKRSEVAGARLVLRGSGVLSTFLLGLLLCCLPLTLTQGGEHWVTLAGVCWCVCVFASETPNNGARTACQHRCIGELSCPSHPCPAE